MCRILLSLAVLILGLHLAACESTNTAQSDQQMNATEPYESANESMDEPDWDGNRIEPAGSLDMQNKPTAREEK